MESNYIRDRLIFAATIMTQARLGKEISVANLNEAAFTLHNVCEFLSLCGLPLSDLVAKELKSEELFLLSLGDKQLLAEREP